VQKKEIGIAGKLAQFFINSPLSVLLTISFIAVGLFALYITPKEEDPQINVPMIDIMVGYPGADRDEVNRYVIQPIERKLAEIKDIEYLYSTARDNGGMIVCRFYVGRDYEKSLVQVYDKLNAVREKLPEGVIGPLPILRTVDDVPVLGITLYSDKYTPEQLRKIALELKDIMKRVDGVGEVKVVGGLRQIWRVKLDLDKMAGYNVSILQIYQILKAMNVKIPMGNIVNDNTDFIVEGGNLISSIDELRNIVVAVYNGKPVYLRDIAVIENTAEEPENYVALFEKKNNEMFWAVTVELKKQKGKNVVDIVKNALKKLDEVKDKLLPDGVKIAITRNFGISAKQKVRDLVINLVQAIIIVTLIMAIFMGMRSGLVAFISIPTTLALALFTNYLYGFTLNRVTLFALVFVIGTLVDNTIIITENIERHFRTEKKATEDIVVKAVDEVGSATIVATITVVLSIMPMAFVTGLMGPYMRPTPVNGSTTMILSLIVAFVIAPYFGYRLLKKVAEEGEERFDIKKTWRYKAYDSILQPILNSSFKSWMVVLGAVIVTLLAVAMLPLKMVFVKTLPYDNKDEFKIILNFPEGTSLEENFKIASEFARFVKDKVPEIERVVCYSGVAAPISLAGLVRHYFLRKGPAVADVHIILKNRDYRKRQTHDIASEVRKMIQPLVKKYPGLVAKVVEIPPGPPAMDSIVIEVYGPDEKKRLEIAKKIKHIMETTPGLADIDWYVEAPQKKIEFVVDKEKATLNGFTQQEILMALRGLTAGFRLVANAKGKKELLYIEIKPEFSQRNNIEKLLHVPLINRMGKKVYLSELVKVKETTLKPSIYKKNLRPVVYVHGLGTGKVEAPVYGMLAMKKRIAKELPYVKQYVGHLPPNTATEYSIKWDGQIQNTYQTFRDLISIFLVVVVLIYMILVGSTGSMVAPFVLLVPIPLAIAGVLPGHWIVDKLLGGIFFSAPSMMGYIASAGIVVRNSVLLVDYIQNMLKEGVPVKDAIITSGAVRAKPIFLTAVTTALGALPLLTDPIFKGMGISFLFGVTTSTALTLMVIPVMYYLFEGRKLEKTAE